MRSVLKWLVGLLLIAAVIFGIAFFTIIPKLVASSLNPVIVPPPYPVSERTSTLHKKLFVADMHADTLLWNYDLNARQTQNQVDVPRLEDGNVALQAFTIVTKSPRGLNIEQNDDKTDSIYWLVLGQRQSLKELSSLTERALRQAAALRDAAENSGGRLRLITSRIELDKFVEDRKTQSNLVGGWLGVEGAHALDGDLANLDRLYDAGIRMMSPSHFFDNDIGGSAHGLQKYGLTDKGKEMIRRMESKKMLVDVAHASSKTIDDVLAMSTRPVVVSHTGVKGTCDNNRNLTDDQIRRIAATGGLIGIGFWDTAVCGEDAASIARAVKYAVNVAGVDHVALGSDFDGSVKVPFDTSGEALITEALLTQGFSDQDIAKVMGGNILELLRKNLPEH